MDSERWRTLRLELPGSFRAVTTTTNQIGTELKMTDCILDGEIVALDDNGIAQFKQLMYGRHDPRFYAFDILWLDGKDLRGLPLIERKAVLRKIIPSDCPSLLYVDHLEEHGEKLFEICCSLDFEGVVAKLKNGKYVSGPETTWAKIRNPRYSQIIGREEMFKKKAA
jgi:bifunctional non-homologous end joining protein LigD